MNSVLALGSALVLHIHDVFTKLILSLVKIAIQYGLWLHLNFFYPNLNFLIKVYNFYPELPL